MRGITKYRRLLVVLMSVAILLLMLAGVGIYGLVRGPSPTADAAGATPTVPSTADPVATPRLILPTADGSAFARKVAESLFTWDTRAGLGAGAWGQAVVDVADPDAATAVASNVRGYFPSPPVWEHLRNYGTRQWLTVTSINVPNAWSTAIEQAAPGQLPPGAIAYTVTGMRNRAGVFDDRSVRSQRSVSFTVFLECPPNDHCLLLRLSIVDEPLR